MKAIRITGIIIGIILLVLVGAYFAMPTKLHVEVTKSLRAPVSDVYAHASNLKTWAEWTRWAAVDTSLKWEYGEVTQGTGAEMTWTGQSGEGILEITDAIPNEKLSYTFLFEGAKPAIGNMTFMPDGRRTTVTWTMDLEVDGLFRYLGLTFQKLIKEDFTEGLERLGRYAHENPVTNNKSDTLNDTLSLPSEQRIY